MNLDFVVIGAQKSASTFLQNCISQHPDVYMPSGETPLFEDPFYTESSREKLAQELSARNESCKGIKRPNYLGLKEVPGRLKNELKNPRFIVVLRNPVDRALSSYLHYVGDGLLPAVHPELGLRCLVDNRAELFDRFPRHEEVLGFGEYGRCLNNYFKFFDREQFFVCTHDEVKTNPLSVIKNVFSFLQLPDFKPNVDSKPQRVTYDFDLLTFKRIKSIIKYNYLHNNTRVSPKKMTDEIKQMEKVVSLAESDYKKTFGVQRVNLSNELISDLKEYYKSDIKNLERILSIDLSNWTRS